MLALVPVKSPHRAKGRLAHLLGPAERAALATVLLGHVTAVLEEAGLEPIVLASGPIETADHVEVWPEEHEGLNRALDSAIRRTGVPVAVVPADLAWLTRPDVEALLAEAGDVVVAAARDDGTNGLLLRTALYPAFGPQSAFVHASRARSQGRRARIVRLAGFTEDVDDAAGLIRARRSPALLGAQLSPFRSGPPGVAGPPLLSGSRGVAGPPLGSGADGVAEPPFRSGPRGFRDNDRRRGPEAPASDRPENV